MSARAVGAAMGGVLEGVAWAALGAAVGWGGDGAAGMGRGEEGGEGVAPPPNAGGAV